MTPHLFQEVAIVPFSSDQIEAYVGQFVRETKVHELLDGQAVWDAKEYLDKLKAVPQLTSLVANPFLLVLALQTLPGIIYGVHDLAGVVVSRTTLYKAFVTKWLKSGERRLKAQALKLSKDENACLRGLSNANFVKVATIFLKGLATDIYTEQDGNPIVRYLHRDDQETWKVKYFGPDTEATLLRNASPLTGSGLIHRFMHRSLLEYFFTFEEHVIHQLKTKRRQEHDSWRQRVHVPLHAKASLHDLEEERPLMEKVQEFLASERQVMLMLGDSGSGKSTFIHHLDHLLWTDYKRGGPIPLFISLATIDDPQHNMVNKQLQYHNFNEDQIEEMKQHRQLILLCEGYDESRQIVNLHTTNMLNRPGQWDTKMIISCRTQYLGVDNVHRFMPQPTNRYATRSQDLFQEVVIAPFSRDHIKSYVEQYAQDTEAALLFRNTPVWSAEEYMEKLMAIPNVMDLVKNPLVLTLALKALPDLFASNTNQARMRITRVELYDIIVNQWLETSRLRLQHSRLSLMDQEVFELVMDADFIQCGIDYLLRLATAIFKEQDGNPIVKYSHLREKNSWKVEFFGPYPEARLLREASPLTRNGNQFRFVHRSILEYFLSRVIYNPVKSDEGEVDPQSVTTTLTSLSFDTNGPLFQRNLLGEPSVIQFLCDRVKSAPDFDQQLRAVIEKSKTDSSTAIAATNAITILVRAGAPFNGADLRGVKIPGADLSGGQFDYAQFQGADLTGAILPSSFP